MKTNRQCLLLNSDFSPICVIDWKKAIVWHVKYNNSFKYSIQIIESYDDYILCANGSNIPVPAVARTTKYYRVHHNKFDLKLSRRNLFTRDNYCCQYCGKYLLKNQLTYDHIIPKSKFKESKMATTWDNVVTACRKCNCKKGNKTPKESGLSLLKQPECPKFSPKYLPWHDQVTNIVYESRTIWDKYIERYLTTNERERSK